MIYRNRLVVRLVGSFFSLCFLALGAYAVLGRNAALDEAAADRALWFGVTVIIAGALALGMSWLIKEVDGVWCGLRSSH